MTNTKQFLTFVTDLSQLGSFFKKLTDDLTTTTKIKVEGELIGLGRNSVIVIYLFIFTSSQSSKIKS